MSSSASSLPTLLLVGLNLIFRQGAERLRHSEARWEGLSDTYDQQVTIGFSSKNYQEHVVNDREYF